MYKPITCENIPKSSIQKLTSKGFYYESDLKGSNTAWVKDICKDIHKQTKEVKVKTALEIFQIDSNNDRIKTGCQALDECLGGGLSCDRVLEVCAAPAQGKTQLCLQFCVCVQLPKSVGGLESDTLYIDTAANFTAHRLKEIAECYESEFQSDLINKWNSTVALSRVHFVKVLGSAQFLAVIFMLEKYLKKHPQIRLVVIDNIASPFKDGCKEIDRIGILYRTMALLNRIAYEKKIAVIVTNEVNLRLGLEQDQVGALGDSWAHLTSRLHLAPPLMAIRHRCGTTPFEIGRRGLSDCAQ